MHGAAGKLSAVFQRLSLRFQPGKRGQQGWVNIQNAIAKRGNELRRKQPHVPRQANQIHALFLQRRDHQFIVGFSFQAF